MNTDKKDRKPYVRHNGTFKNGAIPHNKRHGESPGIGRSPSKEYKAWLKMKSRCNKKNDKDYKNYGGRGIVICAEWVNSYETFLRDVGRAPSMNHSLDRINVNGNYNPENVKWSTKIEQANNTRSNRIITHYGRSLTLAQWANASGFLTRACLEKRLLRGWSFERSISEPLKKSNRW